MQDESQVSKSGPSLHSVNVQSRNLHSPSWEVRAEAADFFGALGAESAVLVVPMLRDLLIQDESWHVRQHAADALQDLGAEAVGMAAPALQKATKEDAHYTVRLAAAVALRTYGHRAEAALPPTKDLEAFTVDQAFDDFVPPDVEDNCMLTTLLDEDKLFPMKQNFLASEETRLSNGDMSEYSRQSPARKYAIVLQRGPRGKWGIDVDFDVHGTCLRVSRVKDGAIADWNKEHPNEAVEIGDFLIEMNGISNDSKELVKVMCKADSLEMVVQKAA